MSKKFLRDLPATEHQLRKIAAVQAGASMHTFIRTAINAHILRAQAADTLHASRATRNVSAALAEASDKPA